MVLSRRLRDSERTFALGATMASVKEWNDDHVRQLQRVTFINIGAADAKCQFQYHNGSAWVNLGSAIRVVKGGGPVSAQIAPSYNRVQLLAAALDASDVYDGPNGLLVLQYANESDLDSAVPAGDND